MAPEHLRELKVAKNLLENPSLTAKITGLVGIPIEKLLTNLPKGFSDKLVDVTQAALQAALKGALFTMNTTADGASPWWHKAAAAVSGGAGGFFGFAALAVELPLSTTIMCRSIADIARAHGEDLTHSEAKLACLQVFALGGSTVGDDAAETGYFAARALMANAVRDAAAHLAKKGLDARGAPAMIRLISMIATRFNVQVTEKAAAQAIPIVGALAGAVINLAFTDHFQDISRGHFTVRRLERLYGVEAVRQEYDRL